MQEKFRVVSEGCAAVVFGGKDTGFRVRKIGGGYKVTYMHFEKELEIFSDGVNSKFRGQSCTKTKQGMKKKVAWLILSPLYIHGYGDNAYASVNPSCQHLGSQLVKYASNPIPMIAA